MHTTGEINIKTLENPLFCNFKSLKLMRINQPPNKQQETIKLDYKRGRENGLPKIQPYSSPHTKYDQHMLGFLIGLQQGKGVLQTQNKLTMKPCSNMCTSVCNQIKCEKAIKPKR
ncbi:hypothetical protein U1Q18_052427 [Sarracenia purpurea var. burkii]